MTYPIGNITRLARTLCVLAIFVWGMTACTQEDDGGDNIEVTSSGAVELKPVVNQHATVTFNAKGSWTASCNDSWLVVTPQKGEAGSNKLTVTALSTNRTGQARTAQLVIVCGATRKNMTVIQSGSYAVFDKKEVVVGPEGGNLTISFSSNVGEDEKLQVGYQDLSWISWADASRSTRSVWKGELPEITVAPNTTDNERYAAFYLVLSKDGEEWMGLDTCYVRQTAAKDDYESTDYSADGRVDRLQKSSQGRGINLVMMGDGFTDRDIADGTYQQVMDKSLENLFTEEPVKSLRNYFNVYAVTAVSKHGRVGRDYSTVFSTVPSMASSNIECNDSIVSLYVSKAVGVEVSRTMAVVILNSHVHNGVTYLYSSSNGKPVQYSVALCPVIDSLNSETFRQVLTHEAIGHGLGKLADEYGYTYNGEATSKALNEVEECHRYNWMLNVDGNSDASKVVWGSFIGDSHFENEQIDVYEGGYTYETGIYRPTEESMMRSNRSPFNAPSRKAIYDKVMELGEGRQNSTLEEFIVFDNAHKPEAWSYATTRSFVVQRRLAPPVRKRFFFN